MTKPKSDRPHESNIVKPGRRRLLQPGASLALLPEPAILRAHASPKMRVRF